MKTKVQKGFTLVGLMIGIVAGIIVLLAAGTILVTGQTFWNEAWEKASLQRDASYAMLRISHSIKAGRSARIEGDGKAIKIYREADWIRFFLDEGSNNLKCEIEGAEPQPIVNDNVEDLEFSIEANKIRISLKLKKGNLQNHLVSTVMVRNYGR